MSNISKLILWPCIQHVWVQTCERRIALKAHIFRNCYCLSNRIVFCLLCIQ